MWWKTLIIIIVIIIIVIIYIALRLFLYKKKLITKKIVFKKDGDTRYIGNVKIKRIYYSINILIKWY